MNLKKWIETSDLQLQAYRQEMLAHKWELEKEDSKKKTVFTISFMAQDGVYTGRVGMFGWDLRVDSPAELLHILATATTSIWTPPTMEMAREEVEASCGVQIIVIALYNRRSIAFQCSQERVIVTVDGHSYQFSITLGQAKAFQEARDYVLAHATPA